MDSNFDKTNLESSKLSNILAELEYNETFYEMDIGFEYSMFEENLKEYCDFYFEFFLKRNDCEIFFDSLVSIVETMLNIDCDIIMTNYPDQWSC